MISVLVDPEHCQREYMEHRWGTRVELDHPVEIECDGERHEGRLRNASISGALIATNVAPPALGEIEVSLTAYVHGEPRSLKLGARVVRKSPGCLGVEWTDMASRPIVELLREAATGRSLWAQDRAFG
jgi:hypothetical protein